MRSLETLYQDCRSYIALHPVGLTSSESLALYEFAEQYALLGKVPNHTIDAAQKVVDKYQKFEIQV